MVVSTIVSSRPYQTPQLVTGPGVYDKALVVNGMDRINKTVPDRNTEEKVTPTVNPFMK